MCSLTDPFYREGWESCLAGEEEPTHLDPDTDRGLGFWMGFKACERQMELKIAGAPPL